MRQLKAIGKSNSLWYMILTDFRTNYIAHSNLILYLLSRFSSSVFRMDIGSKLKRTSRTREDRFSDLPNAVAHHILSFLTNTEDVSRLRCTSKKCEEFCLSLPSLIIDVNQLGIKLDAGSARKVGFMDFIVNLVRRRPCSENLARLAVCCSDVNLTASETLHIIWMLNGATRCHVSEVDLNLKLESGVLEIPLDLFYSDSLNTLKVNLNQGHLKLPFQNRFSYLKYLSLKEVKIVYEDVGKWISSFCKLLKMLWFERVSGINKLKIYSSSLECLIIRHCGLHHIDISSKSLKHLVIMEQSPIRESLNICAPNVCKLIFEASTPNYCSLGKMDLLQSAAISFTSGMDRNKSKSMLLSIAQSPLLGISCACIKALYDVRCYPFIFDNLQTLMLFHFGLADVFIPSMVMFFQGLPCGINTLHIKDGRIHKTEHNLPIVSPPGSGASFWEKQNFSFVGGLEKLVIELLGGEIEQGLVEYLLHNATSLKKLIISFRQSLPTKITAQIHDYLYQGRIRRIHWEERKITVDFQAPILL